MHPGNSESLQTVAQFIGALMLMTPDKNYIVALFVGYVASVDAPA